ncbi:MAG: DUF448 domain-containing protein [Alphaproteobacteria bacterium]|nr:DUF448 domain-containing protein [Alphaproteobacteria bacterium]
MIKSERLCDKKDLRQCCVTKQLLPRDQLLRFVAGPDNLVYFDVTGHLPGRGAWLSPSQTVLAKAIKTKALQKTLEEPTLRLPDDLAEQIAQQLRQRCLHWLGLAQKAGMLVIGFEKIRTTHTALGLLFHANDGSEKEQERLHLPDVPVCDLFSADELSHALGKDFCAHVAVNTCHLTGKLLNDILRLRAFMDVKE